MRILYYNCPAGLSGDMNLGAMVDLGVDPARLNAELQKLGLHDWSIRFEKDQRQGISGTRCDVHYEEHHHHHDHGHHDEGHRHHHHHHHRTFADIRGIIEASGLDPLVKRDAIAVFHALAEAEAAVHGKGIDEIHFHEVGAIDSIVDIVGAAICWNLLGIDSIAASTIELGGGTVKCAHGIMPVPAPATARLVKGFPVSMGGSRKEATTPTGAALLRGRNCVFNTSLQGTPVATGIGIGQRDDPDLANVVYVSLLETAPNSQPRDTVVELVTNLDDLSPEKSAFLMEVLLEAGALDAWQIPATFKKGRLGCELHVLAEPRQRQALADLILLHSSTLGVRWRDWKRTVLDRKFCEINTPIGTVRKKTALMDGQILRSKYEYEDLRRIALEKGLSLDEVERRVKEYDV